MALAESDSRWLTVTVSQPLTVTVTPFMPPQIQMCCGQSQLKLVHNTTEDSSAIV
jgi:hypothetical protein